MVEYVITQRFQEKSVTAPPKLVDGHDLINIFHLSPGPRIGQLLESVREAQASGELTSREEALAELSFDDVNRAVGDFADEQALPDEQADAVRAAIEVLQAAVGENGVGASA